MTKSMGVHVKIWLRNYRTVILIVQKPQVWGLMTLTLGCWERKEFWEKKCQESKLTYHERGSVTLEEAVAKSKKISNGNLWRNDRCITNKYGDATNVQLICSLILYSGDMTMAHDFWKWGTSPFQKIKMTIFPFWTWPCSLKTQIHGNSRILKWRYCNTYKAIFCGDIPLPLPMIGTSNPRIQSPGISSLSNQQHGDVTGYWFLGILYMWSSIGRKVPILRKPG